jgi:hypothetical protein
MIQMGKTKSKKSGSLMRSTAVLGIVLMCSVTSANATWANGYNTITEKNVQTTSEKKDLSELSSRLQSRF